MARELECPPELRAAALTAVDACGIDDGHLSVVLVEEDEMRSINREHRGIDQPTDVLSFPVDGTGAVAGPRELGDVVICAEHSDDLEETVVHGVLHLAGLDHETDGGEMLSLQDDVMRRLRR